MSAKLYNIRSANIEQIQTRHIHSMEIINAMYNITEKQISEYTTDYTAFIATMHHLC